MNEEKQKRVFTIVRNGRWEKTVVGKTGQKYVYSNPKQVKGKDGHFESSQEGDYRKAIAAAIAKNSK